MSLNTELNLADPDAFYERMIELHAGLTDQQSLRLNDRLAALLSATVADTAVLREAVAVANDGANDGADDGADDAARSPIHVAKLILLLANHIGDSAILDRIFSEGARMAAELASTPAPGNVPS
ncbi:DUF2783 domain-containing protein [Trinickia caryophylli]|uniref:DUF2783 domain-containing protein n=1 Tax=Trinickia caryophylli TaxID=28094 RepID=A0A1X7GUA3_TRICW|nr:DUF2783 domain-containing protein [Trinickia caryophylli]WQE11099.1 DUF2783 domain-containing protein [Trinickia caryophylli]GLU35256.1 hypothetical protein Busp01_50980 [Trinickia caryophylli]SMF74692.1 Protein of unknown function [Trinickia caryophylli]